MLPIVAQLEEFQYLYGDPRPLFFQYIGTFNNFTTYAPTVPLKKHMFKFTCDPATTKRTILPPTIPNMRKLKNLVVKGTSPIIVIPVLLMGKLRCGQRSGAQHMNILLYNTLTHEVERIDPKKYHLDGYSLKMLVKNLNKTVDTTFKALDSEARMIPEMDVPLSFAKKMGALHIREVFPLYLLRYLELRSQHPSKTSIQIQSMVLRASRESIVASFNKYVEFRKAKQSHASKCGDAGSVFNPETKRCLRPLTRSFQKILVNPPRKQCPPGKVFHSLSRRCVHPGHLTNIDVMLREASSVNISKTKNFINLGTLTLHIMNYLMRKYPYARFIRTNVKKPKANNLRILWAWNEKTNKFDIKYPVQYWEAMEKGMLDPATRFLVTMVSLHSKEGGRHANVLIYDKNTNEMERFDGLGRDINRAFGVEEFDKVYSGELKKHVAKLVEYLTPVDFCPRMPIFQSKEIDNIPGANLRGNCAVWRAWYIDVRLGNPHLNRKQIVSLAVRKLQDQASSLYTFIKSYHQYILQVVKKQA